RVMVVDGSRAADLLQAEFELEPLPAEGLFFLEEGVRTQLSTGLVVELGDFLQMLEDEGIEPVAERVELVRKLPGEITGKLERREVLSSPKLSGAAAFKGDRLVGWLNERETRGLLWVKGEVRGGTVVVPQPEVQGKFATLEILRAKSKVRPVKKDGKVAIAVKVETEAELREAQAFLDPVNNRELLASIERRLATAIRSEILAAVRRAQADLRSDIFGFGATVHRSLPRDWRRLRDNWDGLFPSLPVEVEVKARLRRSGLAGRSIQIK
ncbi:MAG: Ger(x)C family spore germination protein, partial [Clostridia bacterium]|nr:Ger(x)C family spore germination protein [Clostridia bacterium]